MTRTPESPRVDEACKPSCFGEYAERPIPPKNCPTCRCGWYCAAEHGKRTREAVANPCPSRKGGSPR